MPNNTQLSPEDQARVDQVINSGYNTTERKPFRPFRLLLILWVIVSAMGFFAWSYARYYGLI